MINFRQPLLILLPVMFTVVFFACRRGNESLQNKEKNEPVKLVEEKIENRLKSLLNDSTALKILPEFYTYFGFGEWYRYPLIYPYSLNCVDHKRSGHIYDESAFTSFDTRVNNYIKIDLQIEVQQFNFDDKMLIAELDTSDYSPKYEESQYPYGVLVFKGNQIKRFHTKEEMLSFALKNGYSGEDKLISIPEYETIFY